MLENFSKSVLLKLCFKFQENKGDASCDIDEENGDVDHDSIENGRDGLTGTPDSANSRNDKELEDLMDVESSTATAKTCIMHALSIVSAPASQPGSSPPPIAAIAPHTEAVEAWKPQGRTRLSP